MLAIASRLRRQGKSAKFTPLRTLLIELNDLGSPKSWAKEFASVLDANFLFVPDFQIDVGVGSEKCIGSRRAVRYRSGSPLARTGARGRVRDRQ